MSSHSQQSDRDLIVAAAEYLYDNRLGWGDGRNPYAPRAFWAALGIALGRDMSWIAETDSEEEADLVRGAAMTLLEDAERRATAMTGKDGRDA